MNGQSVLDAAKDIVTPFAKLCEYMRDGDTVIIRTHAGKQYCGVIDSIQREDGSGHCWNVYLHCGSIKMVAFTRTR